VHSKEVLAKNLHTTTLGVERCQRNLNINSDVIILCRNIILNNNSEVIVQGKNHYVSLEDTILTINTKSFTLITAHRKKRK
jgi:hypothetical protein